MPIVFVFFNQCPYPCQSPPCYYPPVQSPNCCGGAVGTTCGSSCPPQIQATCGNKAGPCYYGTPVTSYQPQPCSAPTCQSGYNYKG